MPQINLKNFTDKVRGEKMHTCWLCGGPKYTYAEIKFDSGSVEPTVGETLTGATSGNTGVVVDTEDLFSGTWVGGDAVGVVEVSSPTGMDDAGDIFEEDETITGSTGGADMMTVIYGTEKSYGVMYPLSYLSKYNGKWYCPGHLKAVMESDLRTETKIDTASLEADRGKIP